MINTLMLIDDENLFHLVFEDACSMLDIALSIESLDSSDEADKMFKSWFPDNGEERPECVFVDLNIIGSSFDGIEMIRKINQDYGNGCVIGIISSSQDQVEIEKAKAVGAQFWIIKSDEIEPRLEEFHKDYEGYRTKSLPFKVYK
jgi:CheY-like chemotaxis protein